MPTWILPASAVLGALCGGTVVWLLKRIFGESPSLGEREKKLIDNLQDEVAVLRTRLDKTEEKNLLWMQYAIQLQLHIATEQGPPPPPFPPDLFSTTKES